MAQKDDLSVATIKAAVREKLRKSHQKSSSTQEVSDYIRSKYGKTHVIKHLAIDRAINEMIRRGELRRMTRNGWVQLT